MNLTPAQRRLLQALNEIGVPSAAGFIAEKAGFSGKCGSPFGGAGRAPQWFGRVMKGMPPGLVLIFPRRRAPDAYAISELGRAALKENPND